MSFTRTNLVDKFVLPTLTAISVAFAANANAAGNIEPSTADLSKPVDGCVVTTPGQPDLTAYKKLQDILQRQGQVIAVDANKMGVDGKGGLASTKFSVNRNLSGRDGYIISSSYTKDKNEQSDGFCLSPVKFAIARPLGIPDVPNAVNRGDMGLRLTSQASAGSYTTVFGMHANGAIFAVHFSDKKNLGALVISDGYGKGPGDAAIYKDLEVKPEFKSLLAAAQNSKPPVTVAVAGKDISPR